MCWEWVADLYRKVDEDQTLLLAQAIAFSAFVCVIPGLVVLIALIGFFFASSEDALGRTMAYLKQSLPLWDQAIVSNMTTVVGNRRILGVVGFAGLFITATSLFASARTALDVVFESPKRPGILHGKMTDVLLMVAVGTAFILTVFVLWVASMVRAVGTRLTGVDIGAILWVGQGVEAIVSLALTISVFFIVYRFGSQRKLHIRTALSASLMAGVLWEIGKYTFGYYVTHLAHYDATYGALGTLVGGICWIYYSAVLFLVAGQIGYMNEQRRYRAAVSGG